MIGYPYEYGDFLSDEEASRRIKERGKIIATMIFWSFIFPTIVGAVPGEGPNPTPGPNGANPPAGPVKPSSKIDTGPAVGIMLGAVCVGVLGATLPTPVLVGVGAICGAGAAWLVKK